MFGRKGQGAMEYLMTYGWAVLVVMIVGIVMWQLGIFNLGSTSVTSSGFPKIKPQLTSCKMLTTGAFSCLFTNGAGTAITVDNSELNVYTGSTACVVTAPAPAGTDVEVNLGENLEVTATTCTAGTIGEVYSVFVNITYSQQIAGTIVSHLDSGMIKGPYE